MEDKEIRRKPGRPPTGIGKPIGLRLQPETERKLDQWITQQDDPKPSRPEAIRRLIERATEPGKSCLHLRSETIQAFKKWATRQNLKARDNDDLLMYLIDREYFFDMMLDLTYDLMR